MPRLSALCRLCREASASSSRMSVSRCFGPFSRLGSGPKSGGPKSGGSGAAQPRLISSRPKPLSSRFSSTRSCWLGCGVLAQPSVRSEALDRPESLLAESVWSGLEESVALLLPFLLTEHRSSVRPGDWRGATGERGDETQTQHCMMETNSCSSTK